MIKAYLQLAVVLSFSSPIFASIWQNFTASCSSWQGVFGSTDGKTSTALLSATCTCTTDKEAFSTLDLNTCYGYPKPGTVAHPGCVQTHRFNLIIDRN